MNNDSSQFERCPHCGGLNAYDTTCEDNFHQMLFWESEFPELWSVHHMMVLCYHLQHSHLYSTDGLVGAMSLLHDFVVMGLSSEDVRARDSMKLDSGNRAWKIKAAADSVGVYEQDITWTMTTSDVVKDGADSYVENVKLWAKSVYECLKYSKNLPAELVAD